MDPKDTVIRMRVPETVRRHIWDLAEKECVSFETMCLHLIARGLHLSCYSPQLYLDTVHDVKQ